jgi:hypothetical protein
VGRGEDALTLVTLQETGVEYEHVLTLVPLYWFGEIIRERTDEPQSRLNVDSTRQTSLAFVESQLNPKRTAPLLFQTCR